MSKGIYLSPKHGVNPAIPLCYFCQQPKNEVILPGRMKGDAEAPKNAVWDMEPCDECRGHMQKGILLMSFDPTRTEDQRNPYRTGGWIVIKEEAFTRIFDGDAAAHALKLRWTFMDDETWDAVGLPREDLDIAPAAGGDL